MLNYEHFYLPIPSCLTESYLQKSNKISVLLISVACGRRSDHVHCFLQLLYCKDKDVPQAAVLFA